MQFEKFFKANSNVNLTNNMYQILS